MVKFRLPKGFAHLFFLENENGNTGWKRGDKLDGMDAAAKTLQAATVKSTSGYIDLELTLEEAEFLLKEIEDIYHPYGVIAEIAHSYDARERLMYSNYMRTARRYAPLFRKAITAAK